MHPDTQAALQWMLAHAAEHRNSYLTVYDLLRALTRDERGFAAQLLARYGVSAATLNADLGCAL
jgi:ATP-dependent Clp protease ATP-binding subunit ClpA